MVKKIFLYSIIAALLLTFTGCPKEDEYSEEEAAAMKDVGKSAILAKTVSRPGGQKRDNGKIGGTLTSVIYNDPKTFNTLTARDSSSRSVIDPLYDYLVDYDPYTKEFKPNIASFIVSTDEKNDTTTVRYTLRDDLYWTTIDGKTKVKITSDDVIYWYDEIVGDENVQDSGYAQQFVKMKDGATRRITVTKIDERTFEFHFPRIVDNPVLSSNMDFGPKFLFEKAKKEKGVEGVLNLFSIDTDVKTIPSCGKYYIAEYTPGVRVVMKRNPNYWKKDDNGVSYPYSETLIFKIIPDLNTAALLFKKGDIDYYTITPDKLEEFVNADSSRYTVYNGGTSLNSDFITFNQNPAHVDKKIHDWFAKTEFRQAMSSLVNRERIARQVYRGLGEPALYFYAKPNPMFDEKIKQRFTYDPDRALQLLKSAGFKKGDDGSLYDSAGNKVEFELLVNAENNMRLDMATIFADEASKIGVKINIRSMDFQKMVDMIMSTYDWQATIIGLGENYWPSSGSNVWPSNGNFHLWYPLQSKPATEWEARVDYLYNEGSSTADKKKAKKYWDEYQRILLDQCPVIYLVHPYSFLGIDNKWGNVFYDTLNDDDTLNGYETEYLYLK